jgi:hypothetical protein
VHITSPYSIWELSIHISPFRDVTVTESPNEYNTSREDEVIIEVVNTPLKVQFFTRLYELTPVSNKSGMNNVNPVDWS